MIDVDELDRFMGAGGHPYDCSPEEAFARDNDARDAAIRAFVVGWNIGASPYVCLADVPGDGPGGVLSEAWRGGRRARKAFELREAAKRKLAEK